MRQARRITKFLQELYRRKHYAFNRDRSRTVTGGRLLNPWRMRRRQRGFFANKGGTADNFVLYISVEDFFIE